MDKFKETRLTDHFYGKYKIVFQYSESVPGKLISIILVSYSTTVLRYFPETKKLMCCGLYTQTTRKHISWFISHCIDGLTYKDVKRAYESGEKAGRKYAFIENVFSKPFGYEIVY